jgi:hypothetical protein
VKKKYFSIFSNFFQKKFLFSTDKNNFWPLHYISLPGHRFVVIPTPFLNLLVAFGGGHPGDAWMVIPPIGAAGAWGLRLPLAGWLLGLAVELCQVIVFIFFCSTPPLPNDLPKRKNQFLHICKDHPFPFYHDLFTSRAK